MVLLPPNISLKMTWRLGEKTVSSAEPFRGDGLLAIGKEVSGVGASAQSHKGRYFGKRGQSSAPPGFYHPAPVVVRDAGRVALSVDSIKGWKAGN